MEGTAELVGSADVAKILDVTIGRVNQLANKREDFPTPAAVLPGNVRIWRRTDIERWRDTANREAGRRWPT
jgi:hypothetical protein